MKKKVLIVLLVVLMVGILAFSVVACKGKTTTPTTPTTPTEEEPGVCPICGEGEVADGEAMCSDCASTKNTNLTNMLGAVVDSIDNTLAGIGDIEKQASVSASIFVDVKVDDATYAVKLDIAGSIDDTTANKNWAQIDANILGVEVSLFAVNDGAEEILYVGQNIFNEEKTWSKLDQVADDKLLSETACNAILGLVASLSEKGEGEDMSTVEKLQAGLIGSLAGEILPLVPTIAGSVFTSTTDDVLSFTTKDGYATNLNLAELSPVLGMLGELLGGNQDILGIVETVGGILLGGTVDFSAKEVFTPGPNPPAISLAVGVEDELFTGLELSYAGIFEIEEGKETEISVAFGLDNVSLSGKSKSYKTPFTGAPSDLAIAIDLGLVVPSGICEEAISAQIVINPVVNVDFSDFSAIKVDLSEITAKAIATVGTKEIVVAEYNTDGAEDIYIDLAVINEIIPGYITAENRYYKVPLNLTEKLGDTAYDSDAEVSQAADDFNAINYIYGLVQDIMNGGDIMGTIMGAAGNIEAIIDQLAPLFSEDIIAVADGKATLNVEALIDELLKNGGLIAEIDAEWNSFGLYLGDSDTKAELTLAELLDKDAVYTNIIALVNTIIFENQTEYATYTEWATAGKEFNEEYVTDIASALNIDLDTTNLYEGLSLFVGGYAQDGLGVTLGASIGDETLALTLGLDIVERDDALEGTLEIDPSTTVIDTGATYGEGETAEKGIDILLDTLVGAVKAWLNANKVYIDGFNPQSQA